MASMLGNSRTLRWALCACRQCRKSEHARTSMFDLDKRAARLREERMWRREQT